jgi:hypothetical protein
VDTIQEIARHLSDVKTRENLAVTVAVSKDGKKVTASAADRSTFEIERKFDFGGETDMFLVGCSPFSEGQWTKVTSQPRVEREQVRAVGEAETWMRKFGGPSPEVLKPAQGVVHP